MNAVILNVRDDGAGYHKKTFPTEHFLQKLLAKR
jgi:hypothetical protein